MFLKLLLLCYTIFLWFDIKYVSVPFRIGKARIMTASRLGFWVSFSNYVISERIVTGRSYDLFQQFFSQINLQHIKSTSNSKTHQFLFPQIQNSSIFFTLNLLLAPKPITISLPKQEFLRLLRPTSLNPSAHQINRQESRNLSYESASKFDSKKEIRQDQSQVCKSSRRDLT